MIKELVFLAIYLKFWLVDSASPSKSNSFSIANIKRPSLFIKREEEQKSIHFFAMKQQSRHGMICKQGQVTDTKHSFNFFQPFVQKSPTLNPSTKCYCSPGSPAFLPPPDPLPRRPGCGGQVCQELREPLESAAREELLRQGPGRAVPLKVSVENLNFSCKKRDFPHVCFIIVIF